MDEASPRDAVLATVGRYWGFGELRPLQREAIEAGLAQRDSLVVMPTGGGKSLCYQVPPAVAGRTDVVVSPLPDAVCDPMHHRRPWDLPVPARDASVRARGL